MSTLDDYQQHTGALSIGTAVQVRGVYRAFTDGYLTQDEAELLIAQAVDAANAAAFSLADAYIAIQVEKATGIPTPATGVTPNDGVARLRKAVQTIIGQLDVMVSHAETVSSTTDSVPRTLETGAPAQTAGMRLDRLARAEPLQSGQDASVQAMVAQPLVEGWTRHMDADPCQLCQWWWNEGRIWPKEHRFQAHKGCNCQPKVVFAEHIRSTGYTRQLERNRRAAS